LIALWRETLLAQAVLREQTRGYRYHPQLLRFRAAPDPLAAIATYLAAVATEASCRGYRFDRSKIFAAPSAELIVETQGQLDYEWEHLQRKLALRDPGRGEMLRATLAPEPHPLFQVVPGPVRAWEKR